jgi:hypothetical protein
VTLWNDTFTADTDWSAVSFLNMFAKALNERIKVFPGGRSYGTTTIIQPVTLWNVGDDVQRVGATATNNAGIGDHQAWIEANCIYFAPSVSLGSTYVPVGPVAGDGTVGFTLATFRAAVGLNASGFRRRRPREWTNNLSPTQDDQGNPVADGQIGWYINTATGDVILKQYSVSHSGLIDPVSVPSPGPDTLDSNSASPNHIDYGQMQVGDYIGPHLFTEIRDCYNKLLRTYSCQLAGSTASQTMWNFDLYTDPPADTQIGNTTYVTTNNGDSPNIFDPDPDWATEKQNATDWFNAGTPFEELGVVDLQVGWGFWLDGGYYSGIFAGAFRWGNSIYWEGTSQPRCTIYWIGMADRHMDNIDAGEPTRIDYFDANGTPLLDGMPALLQSYNLQLPPALGGLSVVRGPTLFGGTPPSIPNFPPQPADQTQTTQGYSLKNVIAILDFDVTGGFTYTSSYGGS